MTTKPAASLRDEFPAKWIPLHLLIDRLPSSDRKTAGVGAGQYTVRILPPAPALDESFPDDPFLLDFDGALPDYVTKLPAELDEAVARPNLAQDHHVFEMIEQCGAWVDRILFQTEIAHSLGRCLDLHERFRETDSIGLLIGFHFGKSAGDLSRYIWETWRTGRGAGHPFVIKRPWVTLSRYVPSLVTRYSQAEPPDSSVKVLVVTSSFGHNLAHHAALETYIEQECRSIEEGVKSVSAGRAIEIVRLKDPTFDELCDGLRDTHIFHHFGHGDIDKSGAYILLSDPGGTGGRPIYWYELRDGIEPFRAKRLKLVVLNSCSLQRAGLGSKIAQLGVPAVIAMQAEVTARTIADGFTRELYNSLAAGHPVHAAFSYARRRIWTIANRVEPFVPILVLSTLEDVVIRQPPARQAETAVEPVGPRAAPVLSIADAHQRKWDVANRLEAQGDLDAARIAFTALSRERPDFPGIREKLQTLVDRFRVRAIAAELQQAVSDQRVDGIRAALEHAEGHQNDPAVAAAIETGMRHLAERLVRLREEKKWGDALGVLPVLNAASALVPAERRVTVPALERIEQDAQADRAAQRRELDSLFRGQRWREFVEKVKPHLAVWPDPTLDERLRHAASVLDATDQIQIVSTFDELHQRAADLKAKGDWGGVADVAQQMRRARPGNRESIDLIEEALTRQLAARRDAGEWADTVRICLELADLRRTPQTRRAILDHARAADAVGQWDAALAASDLVLTVDAKNGEARAIKERAEDALRVIQRIKFY